MIVLNKLFAPVLESGISDLGNSGTSISVSKITNKINILTLTNDCVLTLPQFDAQKSVSFIFKVIQDSTGGRNLTICQNNGNQAKNIMEFDFSAGTAEQKCWVTVLFDGTDVLFTSTNYVD